MVVGARQRFGGGVTEGKETGRRRTTGPEFKSIVQVVSSSA
jgi:hypothetical protein